MIKVDNKPSWPASCAALSAAELRLILQPDEGERGGGHQLFIPPLTLPRKKDIEISSVPDPCLFLGTGPDADPDPQIRTSD